jgi:hypothetical protein
MKGDFSRLTFNAKKNYSRVLMQQGRVQLDADWNEQGDILLHYMRTLARDLIGPHGGPEGGGFRIGEPLFGAKPFDFTISKGNYYVDGILCQNPERVSFFNQPYHVPEEISNPAGNLFIYLDVWERHITAYEDPDLFEQALGGTDTASRSQVVWQVKALELEAGVDPVCDQFPLRWEPNVRLRAWTEKADSFDDPCNIEADARYRGFENQLYRVEVHQGNIGAGGEIDPDAEPTFKWSRENGSVVFPIVDIDAGDNKKVTVELAHLGRDEKLGLRKGDVVEIVHDRYALEHRASGLLKVTNINNDYMTVELEGEVEVIGGSEAQTHRLLRRWDQKADQDFEAGLKISGVDAAATEGTKLEDGILIQFVKPDDGSAPVYRTGDYWLIPARTSTRDIEWPKDAQGKALAQFSRGPLHHYAPLARIDPSGEILGGCQRCIQPLRLCPDLANQDEMDKIGPEALSSAPARPAAASRAGLPKKKGRKT